MKERIQLAIRIIGAVAILYFVYLETGPWTVFALAVLTIAMELQCVFNDKVMEVVGLLLPNKERT